MTRTGERENGRTGEREICVVSGRLPDNPEELACMKCSCRNGRQRPTHVMYLHKLKRTCLHHPCMLLQEKQLFQLDSSDFLESGNAKTFLPVISQALRRCGIKVKFMAGFRCSSGNILLNNYCNVLIFIASYCSNPRV